MRIGLFLSPRAPRVFVPNNPELLALVALGKVRTLFFDGDHIKIAVVVEVDDLNQIIDEAFRAANGRGCPARFPG